MQSFNNDMKSFWPLVKKNARRWKSYISNIILFRGKCLKFTTFTSKFQKFFQDVISKKHRLETTTISALIYKKQYIPKNDHDNFKNENNLVARMTDKNVKLKSSYED